MCSFAKSTLWADLHNAMAKDIINEVVGAVKDWRVSANRLGIAKREMSLFEGVFDSRYTNNEN